MNHLPKLEGGQYYKTFLGVIYTTSGVFPYDFDWGYTDSDVITPKKFYNIDHSYRWPRRAIL